MGSKSKVLQASLTKFREVFTFGPKDNIQWFPGHMRKGINVMQKKLRMTDCIIEVHDARIPFSGRNALFRETLGTVKPHILLLNKMDFADLSRNQVIRRKLLSENVDRVIYTNCSKKSDPGLKSVIPTAVELINNSNRFNRSEAPDFTIMVIGVPNVGKSSLINNLRTTFTDKGNAALVGGKAGVTRAVQEKIRVCSNPLIYVFDTPGVLEPHVKNAELSLRLALCGTFNDYQVGFENIADYLLYWMNKHRNFGYVDALNLKEPSDDIREVLFYSALNLKAVRKHRTFDGKLIDLPDRDVAAEHFVSLFRKGKLGKFMLDDDRLSSS